MATTLHAFAGETDTQDVFFWVKHIDLTAACQGWTEAQKVCYAANSLTGTAWIWAMSHNFDSWAQFKASICERYGEDAEVLAHKLQNCEQHPKESVLQYSDRFRLLAARLAITPCAMPPRMLRTLFVRGLLPDLQLQAALVIKASATLDEAVQEVKYLENHLGFCQSQDSSESQSAYEQAGKYAHFIAAHH